MTGPMEREHRKPNLEVMDNVSGEAERKLERENTGESQEQRARMVVGWSMGYNIFYNVLLHPKMNPYWAKLPVVEAAILAHPKA